MHDIYCLQLERFLCRECGKVKCSCNLTPVTVQEDIPKKTEETAASDSESIEFRRPELTRKLSETDHNILQKKLSETDNNISQRKLSETDNNISQKPPLPLSYRASEQPFTRSSQGENGKLRRSLAVRSREGLENLLNTIRKSPDSAKAKLNVRQ